MSNSITDNGQVTGRQQW